VGAYDISLSPPPGITPDSSDINPPDARATFKGVVQEHTGKFKLMYRLSWWSSITWLCSGLAMVTSLAGGIMTLAIVDFSNIRGREL